MEDKDGHFNSNEALKEGIYMQHGPAEMGDSALGNSMSSSNYLPYISLEKYSGTENLCRFFIFVSHFAANLIFATLHQAAYCQYHGGRLGSRIDVTDNAQALLPNGVQHNGRL